MKEAATGFVYGNLLAIVLGIAFVQLPLIEKALLRIAVATYCLPIIAIGPILTFVLHGDAPQSRARRSGRVLSHPCRCLCRPSLRGPQFALT